MADFKTLDRRDALKGLLAISAAGALAACGPSDGVGSDAGGPKIKVAAPAKLSAKDMALVAALAQTIIPKTDTAGAVEAGVPQTVQELYTDWGDDNYRSYWASGLAGLRDHFLKTGGQDFADMSAAQQLNSLGKYDAKAFADSNFTPFYRDFKRTVATAYYMSEPGASEELAYESVPGDWRGCVPLSDQPKTWAT